MYYLIEISKGDPKINGKGIYEYETRNEAIAKFHSKLGTAMSSELYDEELLLVVDGSGYVIESNSYIKGLNN